MHSITLTCEQGITQHFAGNQILQLESISYGIDGDELR